MVTDAPSALIGDITLQCSVISKHVQHKEVRGGEGNKQKTPKHGTDSPGQPWMCCFSHPFFHTFRLYFDFCCSLAIFVALWKYLIMVRKTSWLCIEICIEILCIACSFTITFQAAGATLPGTVVLPIQKILHVQKCCFRGSLCDEKRRSMLLASLSVCDELGVKLVAKFCFCLCLRCFVCTFRGKQLLWDNFPLLWEKLRACLTI